jgi:plasmid stability protein
VAYLLIPNIDPRLRRQLIDRARSHRRSLSDEARILLERELLGPLSKRKLGTELMRLAPDEYRGDDLVFEIRGEISEPPDFNDPSFDPKES